MKQDQRKAYTRWENIADAAAFRTSEFFVHLYGDKASGGTRKGYWLYYFVPGIILFFTPLFPIGLLLLLIVASPWMLGYLILILGWPIYLVSRAFKPMNSKADDSSAESD